MAQEARKPLFALKPADGALGAHVSAVREAYKDFKRLALEIARRRRGLTAYRASTTFARAGVRTRAS